MSNNRRKGKKSYYGKDRFVKDSYEYNDNKNNDDIIEGRNSVLEALKSNRTVEKILISNGKKEGSIFEIINLAKKNNIIITEVDRRKLDSISQTHSHQGVIAYVSKYEYVEIGDILKSAKQKKQDPFIIILDEITDPHNLGSVLRSANAAGVHGVIIPKRRSVGLNSVVSKSSAGAVEYTSVAKVTNIAQTIDLLKDKGIWVAGAAGEATEVFYDTNLKGAIALVIGSEGKGMSRLVREKCDFLVKIPMTGQISSLNAGVAAGILMFEVVRQRRLSE